MVFGRISGRRLAVGLMAISAVLSWVWAVSPIAFASHAHSNPLHIFSVHSGYYDEEICVDAAGTNGAISDLTLANRVKGSLWQDNPGGSWDGHFPDDKNGGHPKVWFAFRQVLDTPCRSYQAQDLNNTEVAYYAMDDPTAYCWNTSGVSCAHLDAPIAPGVLGNTHTDYTRSRVYLKTSHINGPSGAWDGTYGWHHTINHETGHSLGFIDPPEGGVDCPADPGSVMHSRFYGCVNREYPTSNDINGLQTIVQSTNLNQ